MELEKVRSREPAGMIETNREELNSFLMILHDLPLVEDIIRQKTIKKFNISPDLENTINHAGLDIPFDLPILEDNIIVRRIDSFIGRSFEITSIDLQAIMDRYPARPEFANQYLPYNRHKCIFSSGTGLTVSLDASVSGLTVGGVRVVGEGEVARVNFTPNGRSSFDRKQMTDSLAMGIQGFRELMQAADRGELEGTQTLVGTTNINMALIAQRLGFAIVDQDRTPDGNIDATKGSFTVVARIEDVQARIREFEELGAVDRLQKRHKKQSARAN